MAIVVNFDGKKIVEPGVYSRIQSGIPQPPSEISSGDIMIIDTGSAMTLDAGVGASPAYAAPIYWGGGSGINGAIKNGSDAVYVFDDVNNFTNYVRGGLIRKIGEFIFNPTNDGTGSKRIYYVSAKTSTKATILKTFTNGTLSISPRTEGTSANGRSITVSGTPRLTIGFGAKITAGIVNPAKFKLRLFVGTFTGYDATGIPFDGLREDQTTEEFLLESPEVANITELATWCQTNKLFQSNFVYNTHTISSGGAILVGDITSGFELATGGSETFGSTDLDTALETIVDEQNSLFLCDRWGIGVNGALSTQNLKILDHIKTKSTFGKMMFVGGGNNSTQFALSSTGSMDIALAYNDKRVVTVHSGVNIADTTQFGFNGYRTYESIVNAALVAGRIGGLEPQVSPTFKSIRILSPVHALRQPEREVALQGGVLHVRSVPSLGWVINQGVTTLQDNERLVTDKGESFEISVERISNQLNKELIIEGYQRHVGGNLHSASPEKIKTYVVGFLQKRCAIDNQDNLLISFQDVKVVFKNDSYFIEYGFVPNFPINKLFYTGFMLEYTTA